MSTPLPNFAKGTRVYGQNAAGVRGPGWIYAEGAAEGQNNIVIINETSGAMVVVANAAYLNDESPFDDNTAQFKLNFAHP